jgi:hypothetical protein
MFNVILLLSVAIGLSACCTGNNCNPAPMNGDCGCGKDKVTY